MLAVLKYGTENKFYKLKINDTDWEKYWNLLRGGQTNWKSKWFAKREAPKNYAVDIKSGLLEL